MAVSAATGTIADPPTSDLTGNRDSCAAVQFSVGIPSGLSFTSVSDSGSLHTGREYNKKMQEKMMKIVLELASHDENRYCFDCHQRGPTYVNMTVGSFVCTSCGGALRKYNHRVKSISMSNFSQNELDFLCKWGNKACRRVYFGQCINQSSPEPDLKSGTLDDFLRQKYQLKRWYTEPTEEIKAEAILENQCVIDRVEKAGGSSSRNQRSIPGNTASGLIVLPSRPPGNVLTAPSSANISQSVPSNLNRPESSNAVTSPSSPNQNVIPPHRLQTIATSVTTANNLRLLSSTPSTKFPNVKASDPFGDLAADPFNPWSAAPSSGATISDPFGTTVPFSSLIGCKSGATDDLFIGAIRTSSATSNHPPSTEQFSSARSVGGDKYAALAELDGMFKSACSTTATPTKVPASVGLNQRQASAIPISNGPWCDQIPFTTAVRPVPIESAPPLIAQVMAPSEWATKNFNQFNHTYESKQPPQSDIPFGTAAILPSTSRNPFLSDIVSNTAECKPRHAGTLSSNPFATSSGTLANPIASSNPFIGLGTNQMHPTWEVNATVSNVNGFHTIPAVVSNPFLQMTVADGNSTTGSDFCPNELLSSATNPGSSLFR